MGGCCGSMKIGDGKLHGAMMPTSPPHTNGKSTNGNISNGNPVEEKIQEVNGKNNAEITEIDSPLIKPSIMITDYENDSNPTEITTKDEIMKKKESSDVQEHSLKEELIKANFNEPNCSQLPREIDSPTSHETSVVEEVLTANVIEPSFSEIPNESEPIVNNDVKIPSVTQTDHTESQNIVDPELKRLNTENANDSTDHILADENRKILLEKEIYVQNTSFRSEKEEYTVSTSEIEDPKEEYKISVGERIDQLLNEGMIDDIIEKLAISTDEMASRRQSNEIISDVIAELPIEGSTQIVDDFNINNQEKPTLEISRDDNLTDNPKKKKVPTATLR